VVNHGNGNLGSDWYSGRVHLPVRFLGVGIERQRATIPGVKIKSGLGTQTLGLTDVPHRHRAMII